MDNCVEAEIEGGGWHWWYVCSECHGILNERAKICPNCNLPINWDPRPRITMDKRKGDQNHGNQETAQPQEEDEASGFQGDSIPSPSGPQRGQVLRQWIHREGLEDQDREASQDRTQIPASGAAPYDPGLLGQRRWSGLTPEEIDRQRVEGAVADIIKLIDGCNPFVPVFLFEKAFQYTLDKVPNRLKKEILDRVMQYGREKRPDLFDEKGELNI